MTDYNVFGQIFDPQLVKQAIYMAQTFDRNNAPIKKLKALDDCANAAEKLYNASKELNSDYWASLGLGVAFERFQQCQMQDQNQQGVIR